MITSVELAHLRPGDGVVHVFGGERRRAVVEWSNHPHIAVRWWNLRGTSHVDLFWRDTGRRVNKHRANDYLDKRRPGEFDGQD